MNELMGYEDVKSMSAEQLGSEIRMLTRQAKTMVLNYGIQIGYRLYVAKEKVDNFVEWVERETEFSKSSAYRFIQLYTEYGSNQGSLLGVENVFPTLGKVSISNALRLLAIPEEEREEFAKEVDAENISARELDAAIAARREAEERVEQLETEILKAEDTARELRRELEDTKEELDDAVEERDDLKDELKELKSRPVEVAVQEPDPAEIEAAAKKAVEKAEAEHRKAMDDLRRKLAEAEKRADELKAELEEPAETEELAGELERAKEEAETLRKKLAAADSGAGEAAIYCKTAQENFLAALDKVAAMKGNHPETAVKLLRGLHKIVDAMEIRAMDMAEEWGVEL